MFAVTATHDVVLSFAAAVVVVVIFLLLLFAPTLMLILLFPFFVRGVSRLCGDC